MWDCCYLKIAKRACLDSQTSLWFCFPLHVFSVLYFLGQTGWMGLVNLSKREGLPLVLTVSVCLSGTHAHFCQQGNALAVMAIYFPSIWFSSNTHTLSHKHLHLLWWTAGGHYTPWLSSCPATCHKDAPFSASGKHWLMHFRLLFPQDDAGKMILIRFTLFVFLCNHSKSDYFYLNS